MKCSKCGGPICAWCGKPVRRTNRFGRTEKYCCEAHRKAAAKQRRKDRRKQVPIDHFNGQERIL